MVDEVRKHHCSVIHNGARGHCQMQRGHDKLSLAVRIGDYKIIGVIRAVLEVGPQRSKIKLNRRSDHKEIDCFL